MLQINQFRDNEHGIQGNRGIGAYAITGNTAGSSRQRQVDMIEDSTANLYSQRVRQAFYAVWPLALLTFQDFLAVLVHS